MLIKLRKERVRRKPGSVLLAVTS